MTRRTLCLRALGIAGCLGFAALALGSGLDRLSPAQPALAASVPAAFASQSWQVRARSALAAGDAVAATTYATAAVRAAPLDPATSALLGAAWLARGQGAEAERAFRIAGQLGWRVPATQLYWLSQSTLAGDHRTAALRLDALLRQDPGLLARLPVAAGLESSEPGRAALAARLANRPPWGAAYAASAAQLEGLALDQRVAVLLAARSGGGALGCSAIAPLADHLLAVESYAVAAALWRGHCPATATFQHSGPGGGILAWHLANAADVGLAWVDGTGNWGELAIATSAPVTRPVAIRRMILPPGRHVIRWNGKGAGALVASLSCGIERWTRGVAHPDGGWQAVIELPATCPAPWLKIGVMPNTAQDTTLRGVTVTRAPAG